MKKALHLAALLLCATACIYPFNPELGEAPEGVLVVEGEIVIGGTSTIRLGLMNSLYSTDTDPMAWNGLYMAKVWVEDSAGDTYPSKAVSGTTYIISTESAPADREYRARIEVNGALYSSDWAAPLQGPEIRAVEFSADNYSVIVNVTLDGGPESTGYVALSYDETWEFHSEFSVDYAVDPLSWAVYQPISPINYPNYWCWQSNDNRQSYPIDFSAMEANGVTAYPLFSFLRTDNRNHRRYSVNIKAKTISKGTYRYLSHLDEDTNGGGDLFSPNPGEVAGNLRCESDGERMVLGYVTTSQVTSRRAWLDSRYLKSQSINFSKLYYITQSQYPEYYEAGYLPLVENPHADFAENGEGPYGWGAMRCYDCIVAGGNKNKPDYWDE